MSCSKVHEPVAYPNLLYLQLYNTFSRSQRKFVNCFITCSLRRTFCVKPSAAGQHSDRALRSIPPNKDECTAGEFDQFVHQNHRGRRGIHSSITVRSFVLRSRFEDSVIMDLLGIHIPLRGSDTFAVFWHGNRYIRRGHIGAAAIRASFVKFFCKPGNDNLTNYLAGQICAGWVVFGNYQKLVFHEIASKRAYEQITPGMSADLFPQARCDKIS